MREVAFSGTKYIMCQISKMSPNKMVLPLTTLNETKANITVFRSVCF